MEGKWKNECDRRDVQGQKKRGNHRKQFTFVVGSCAHFRNFGVGSTISHKGADDDKSIAKGDGDGVAWRESDSEEKTRNPGQNYISGKRY